jgi:hypothetical protein
MTRRATEAFLRDNPSHLPTSANAPRTPVMDTASDSHPYNMGLIWASVGSLDVYMFVDTPGVYWLDFMKHRPASDAQAKAAWGLEAFNRHRREGAEKAQEQRINSAVEQAVTARDATELSAEQRKMSCGGRPPRPSATCRRKRRPRPTSSSPGGWTLRRPNRATSPRLPRPSFWAKIAIYTSHSSLWSVVTDVRGRVPVNVEPPFSPEA